MKKIYLCCAVLFACATSSAQTYFDLSVSSFTQDWTNTGLITTSDDWSGVPFIRGFRGDDITTVTGTDPQTLLAGDDPGVLDVNANQTNPAVFATGGVAEFEITNPVVALSGSGTGDAPYLKIYLNSSGRQFVTLNFNAIDIDGSVDNSIQQLAVQYRIGNSGSFTNLPLAYISDASTGPNLSGNTTPVSVVLPILADNAAQLEIRIMTTNAIGNDEWIGIDDIIVTSSSITLPVVFTNFNGNYKNNAAQLNWGAYVTGNNNYFSVEKSLDGRSFSTLTTVTAQNGDHQYTYSDASASAASAYYRVAFVENGISKYSGIIRINGETKQGLDISRLYATGNILHVQIGSNRQSTATVFINDMNGRLLLRQDISLQKGSQLSNISLPDLKAGVYMFRIDNGEERITKQWMKQ